MRNGIIKTRKIFVKKIPLSEIKTVLKTDKTYVLKTADTELKIDTEIIDFETLEKFTAELKKLDIEWY
jgi:hypothetical protein